MIVTQLIICKEHLLLARLIRPSKRSSCTYTIELKSATISSLLLGSQFIYFPNSVKKRAC